MKTVTSRKSILKKDLSLQPGVSVRNPLQMLAERRQTSRLYAPAGDVAQRTTVMVGTPKDEQDFAYGAPLLQSYLGEEPVWLSQADLGNLTNNQLNIWAHMDTTTIGGMSHANLAKILVKQGYRSSNPIRLIGCNLQKGKAMISPGIFWRALQGELKELGMGLTPPAIYATKGPLHTGGDNLTPEQRWYIEDKKYEDTEALKNKHVTKQQPLEVKIDEKMKKFKIEAVDDAPGKFLEEFKEKNPDSQLTDDQIKESKKAGIAEKAKSLYDYYVSYYLTNNKVPEELSEMKARHRSKLSLFFDQRQSETNRYPSIFKKDEKTNSWTWNDIAWVKFDGNPEVPKENKEQVLKEKIDDTLVQDLVVKEEVDNIADQNTEGHLQTTGLDYKKLLAKIVLGTGTVALGGYGIYRLLNHLKKR